MSKIDTVNKFVKIRIVSAFYFQQDIVFRFVKVLFTVIMIIHK